MATIIEATGEHKATVIFAHGLGDQGVGWSEVLEGIGHPNIKYICPNAPVAPVSLNMGYPMPSWFDIFGLTPDSKEDVDGIKKSANKIIEYVESEIKAGIPASKIIIGGFSQGGAISLYAGLTYKEKLGGIVALSTWLPVSSEFPDALKNPSIPIFQGHGDDDHVVATNWGAKTKDHLKEWGCDVEWHVYKRMAHSYCEAEFEDLKVFIKKLV